MSEAQTQTRAGASTVTKEEEGGLLDQIISETRIGRDEEQRQQSRQQIATLVEEVMKGSITVSKDIEAMINARIADIDALLSRQLNEIMHHPDFQKLEGSWRGLNYLVMNTETAVHLKLRLMNITKQELLDDLEKAVEFDQSQMFKKLYEEEYGTFGGHPYSCLIGDFEFTRHPQDMEL